MFPTDVTSDFGVNIPTPFALLRFIVPVFETVELVIAVLEFEVNIF